VRWADEKQESLLTLAAIAILAFVAVGAVPLWQSLPQLDYE